MANEEQGHFIKISIDRTSITHELLNSIVQILSNQFQGIRDVLAIPAGDLLVKVPNSVTSEQVSAALSELKPQITAITDASDEEMTALFSKFEGTFKPGESVYYINPSQLDEGSPFVPAEILGVSRSPNSKNLIYLLDTPVGDLVAGADSLVSPDDVEVIDKDGEPVVVRKSHEMQIKTPGYEGTEELIKKYVELGKSLPEGSPEHEKVQRALRELMAAEKSMLQKMAEMLSHVVPCKALFNFNLKSIKSDLELEALCAASISYKPTQIFKKAFKEHLNITTSASYKTPFGITDILATYYHFRSTKANISIIDDLTHQITGKFSLAVMDLTAAEKKPRLPYASPIGLIRENFEKKFSTLDPEELFKDEPHKLELFKEYIDKAPLIARGTPDMWNKVMFINRKEPGDTTYLAYLSLFDALKEYDETKGTAFNTFWTMRFKNLVNNYLRMIKVISPEEVTRLDVASPGSEGEEDDEGAPGSHETMKDPAQRSPEEIYFREHVSGVTENEEITTPELLKVVQDELSQYSDAPWYPRMSMLIDNIIYVDKRQDAIERVEEVLQAQADIFAAKYQQAHPEEAGKEDSFIEAKKYLNEHPEEDTFGLLKQTQINQPPQYYNQLIHKYMSPILKKTLGYAATQGRLKGFERYHKSGEGVSTKEIPLETITENVETLVKNPEVYPLMVPTKNPLMPQSALEEEGIYINAGAITENATDMGYLSKELRRIRSESESNFEELMKHLQSSLDPFWTEFMKEFANSGFNFMETVSKMNIIHNTQHPPQYYRRMTLRNIVPLIENLPFFKMDSSEVMSSDKPENQLPQEPAQTPLEKTDIIP